MSFIIQAPAGGGSYFNDELGFGLDDGEERDLLLDANFLGEVLASSSLLQSDLIAGTVNRLDAFGGNIIPPALAFEDLSVANHQSDPTAHGLAIATIKQITDAGSGQIIATVERNKLAGVETGAEVNDTGAEIVTKLQGEPQPLTLDVTQINGNTSADLLDRANHTGTQLAATISDFDSAADARITLQKGANNGLASLDGSGQIPVGQLGNIPPAYTPKGNWDAATNTPTLASGVGTIGDVYRVSVAGSTNLDGITDWQVNDQAYFASGQWFKTDNSDSVVSVNGQAGAVVLDTGDISENGNLYYTDGRVAASPSVVLNTAKVSADGSINTHSDVNTGGATDGQALILNAGVWSPQDLAGEAPQPVVQARLSTAFALTTGVWTPIPFDLRDEETDPASVVNPVGNADTIIVKDVTAPIELVAWIPWDATTSDSMSIRIRKNDTIVVPGSEATIITYDDFSPICVVVKVPRSFMVAGDFFRVEMIENAGVVSVLPGATFQATQLKGVKGPKGDTGAGTSIDIEDNAVPVLSTGTINFGLGLQAVDDLGNAKINIRERMVFVGKDNNQVFSGTTTVLFETIIRPDALGDFTVSVVGTGTRITCNFTGEVIASFDLSIDRPSTFTSRAKSLSKLLKNGVAVPYSDRYGYHRNQNEGSTSMSLSLLPVTVSIGDYFEVQSTVANGGGSLDILGNACIFKVKRIS